MIASTSFRRLNAKDRPDGSSRAAPADHGSVAEVKPGRGNRSEPSAGSMPLVFNASLVSFDPIPVPAST